MVMMEGMLWKWTNYLSGWQPRWFVLEVGVLAYYKSQEEVGRGSRGSIKMACCEISVHHADTLRIDLKVPPEQYIYLRAATPAERQQWLVALGTAKACITQTNGHRTDLPEHDSMRFLRERMSELSVCRNILLQQINTIKSITTFKDDNRELTEAATLVTATCDTFLSHLCDCMEIAENNFDTLPTSPVTSPPGISISSPGHHSHFRKKLLQDGSIRMSPPPSPTSSIMSSISSSTTGGTSAATSVEANTDRSTAHEKHLSQSLLSPLPSNSNQNNIDSQSRTSSNFSLNYRPNSLLDLSTQPSLDSHSTLSEEMKDVEMTTFFSVAPHRFENIILEQDNGIPTKPFLAACECVLPFFDVLGSTAFAPVKLDINGNIKKIQGKHDTDPNAFITLQNIIYQELKSNTCTAKNSATDALLWLKRALEFMQCFLQEVIKEENDLSVAAGTAYAKTLRKYHGWVVRGVFALAVKAVPYREDFFLALRTTDRGCSLEADVIRDMKSFVQALSHLTAILNQFYRKHKLDSDTTV